MKRIRSSVTSWTTNKSRWERDLRFTEAMCNMDESNIPDKKRGWGLTIILLYSILSSLALLARFFYSKVTGDNLLPNRSIGQEVFFISSNIFYIIFLIAAWRWKKWGCFGFIALSLVGGFNILINDTVSVPKAFALLSLFTAFIAYTIYKSKKEYFD